MRTSAQLIYFIVIQTLKLMKKILLLALAIVTVNAWGATQNPAATEKNKEDRKNRRHGYWEFYHDDANTIVANKGTFKHGKQVKAWYYYDADGHIEKMEEKKWLSRKTKTTMYHKNGAVHKTGYARTRKTKEYIEYYWFGTWKCYDENGIKLSDEVYKNGELVGANAPAEIDL